MPIKVAAIVPNSPLLLPGLVKGVQTQMGTTMASLEKIKRLAELARPEVLILICQDETIARESPVLLQASYFDVDFSEQGDLVTVLKVPGAVGFVHSLKEKLESKLTVPMRTPQTLPASIGVALLNLPNIPVAPIILPPKPSPQLLLDLGLLLNDFFALQKQRLLLIASGQLGIEQKVLSRAVLKGLASSDSDSLMQLRANLNTSVRDTLVDPSILLYRSLPAAVVKTTILSSQDIQALGQIVAKVTW